MPGSKEGELAKLRLELDEVKSLQQQNNEKQDRRWEQLARMVEQNTEATKAVAVSVQAIAVSTEDVVQLYADFQGAARMGVRIRKVLAWLVATGAAVAAAVLVLLDKLGLPTDPPA